MSLEHSVLICDQVNPVLNEILEKNGLKITYEPEISPEQIAEKIENFEVVIVRSRTKLTKDLIEKANKCQIIARVGVGLDNIDQNAAKEKNIRVINAVEGAMNAVAELVLGLMFSLAREIPRADREVRNGNWIKKELMGTELRGKYLGIVGLGNIGKRLGRLARALNMNIIGFDVAPIDEEFSKEVGLMKADLGTLLASSDYVSLHVPLLDSTKHLINAEKMTTMKNTARIINTSRGKCINIRDLIQSFESNKILGACLDVLPFENISFESISQESNELRYLMSSRKTILSPHIAGWTQESRRKIADLLLKKITRFHDQL